MVFFIVEFIRHSFLRFSDTFVDPFCPANFLINRYMIGMFK
ncbi:MAG: hypothetical protein RJA57_805, partial [Bacteroidota bacterium]